ncbi:hypothetical protein RSAG8_04538, partial [Rhizoctonia solani AG-8 WAC10335]
MELHRVFFSLCTRAYRR